MHTVCLCRSALSAAATKAGMVEKYEMVVRPVTATNAGVETPVPLRLMWTKVYAMIINTMSIVMRGKLHPPGGRYAGVWIVLAGMLLLYAAPASAQRQAWNWYFGDSLSVSFATGAPVVGRGSLDTREGCAAWSDAQTGAPLLYTDGRTVWDGTGTIMSNGTGLEGHESSTQSALLVPQPGNPDQFFLFTAGVGPYEVPDNNGIRYSIVDVAGNNVPVRNLPLLTPATEKLAGVRHCNETDYWVVSQQWGTNRYYAWQLTTSGVASQPVVSTTGTVAPLDFPAYTIGCLKASPNGRRLVNTGYYPDAVQLFDFNNATGVVSNPLTLPTNDIVYCASFSPDNTRLYLFEQRLGSPRSLIRLYQYTVTGTPQDIVQSRTLIFELLGTLGDEPGTLQIAPDGKIYYAREGGLYLGVINNPNADASLCDYVHDGLYLDGRRSMLGLPNFVDGLFNTGASCFPPEARFEIDTTICAGMCLAFTDRSLNQPSAWRWELPGGTPPVATEPNPTVCYATPGVYDVRLIVSNPQGVDTLLLEDAVTVLPRLGASAGNDTAVCAGESATLRGSGGERYMWRPATGLSHPDSAVTQAQPETTTTYILTTYAGTCEDEDTVTVTVFPRAEAVGGAYTICAGDSVRHEAAGTPGTYRWFPTDGVSNPDTSAPLLFPHVTTEYSVTVTSADGCTSTATVRVEIGEAMVEAGADTTVCAGESVRLTASGMTGSYRWTPTAGLDDPTSATPLATPDVTTVYTVTVTSAGGCTATDSVTVTVLPLPAVDAGPDVTICKNSSVLLVAEGGTGTYTWEPADGLDTPDSSATMARPATTTTYRVTYTDAGGCTATDEITVTVDEHLAIDAGADRTICAGDTTQLDAWAGSGSYRWTPATGLDDPTSPRPFAAPARTTVYYVEVETDGGCSGRDSVTVTVVPPPVIDVGETRSVCRGGSVRLAVTTDGGSVGWEPAALLDDPTSRTPLATPDETTLFTVTVYAPNGCTTTGSVLVVVAVPEVHIAENDTTICAGGELLLHVVGGSGSYRWEPAVLVDNPDAAVTTVHPTQATTFRVTYTDDAGCTATDSITVTMQESVPAVITLPDTVAVPGTRGLHLPVVVRVPDLTGIPSNISIRFELAYNARLLDFTGVTRGRILGNDIASGATASVLTVLVENVDLRTLPGGVLTSLVADVLLSATDTTALVLRSVTAEPSGPCLLLQPLNGRLQLDGYCFGSDFRRFDNPEVSVTPNPASDRLDVLLRAPDGTAVTTALYTTWGECVRFGHVVSSGGQCRFSYDVMQLAAGVYYLTVDLGGVRLVQPVCIVK